MRAGEGSRAGATSTGVGAGGGGGGGNSIAVNELPVLYDNIIQRNGC